MIQIENFININYGSFYLMKHLNSPKFIYDKKALHNSIDKPFNDRNQILKSLCFFGVASFGTIDFLKQILDSGIDLGVKDKKGTSLGVASLISATKWNSNKNWMPIVNCLLENNVDINSTSYDGCNAIKAATNFTQKERIEKIIALGGTPNMLDKFNRNALSYLVKDDREIANLIISENTSLLAIDMYNQNILESLKRRNFHNSLDVINSSINALSL